MVPRPDDGPEDAGGVAVLFSAGLDSTVLLTFAGREATSVQPIYVRSGLAWEDEELAAAERLLDAGVLGDNVRPLVLLNVDMRDVYSEGHWAVRGEPPSADTPDEDVYLDGRNIVLLAKASVFMAGAGIHRIFIGPLAGNPFPDATPAFFQAMGHALGLGLDTSINIEAPLLGVRKPDVIRLGVSLGVPMEMTVSCMQPREAIHCGHCSKCRERRDAFIEAGVVDEAPYQLPAET
jgi:7-cyano-7-deazaguanine synthase